MSCAWKNPKCRIGLIIGTGTNACYLEEMDKVSSLDSIPKFRISDLKFMFSKKATKIDEIFTVDLTLCNCQIGGEDFVNFCGLFRKLELY